MRKTYQTPTMDIVHIAAEEMLASSDPDVKYSKEKVDNEAAALGKKRDIWADNSTNRSLW